MLTENQITSRLAEYLIKEGYDIVQALNTGQKGIDIIANDRKTGKQIQIEVKGATSANPNSKRYSKGFSRSQVQNHISRAVFSALSVYDKNRGNDKIISAMAFPNDYNHKDLLSKISISLSMLEIKIYLVSESGITVY